MKSIPGRQRGWRLWAASAVVVALATGVVLWIATRNSTEGTVVTGSRDGRTTPTSTRPRDERGDTITRKVETTKTAATRPPPPPSQQTLTIGRQTEIPLNRIRRPGGARAAIRLSALSQCAPRVGVSVRLRWSVAGERGAEQRVALTHFADGFETGRFAVSPQLSPSASTFDWRKLEPGVFYRWRLFTRHGETYTPSEIASFRGADCFAP